jgi:peptidyl-prolyl cis-trans isomerase C
MNVVTAFCMSNPVSAARAGAAALCIAIVLGAAAPCLAESPSTDPVVAIVNGTQVHESELKLADEIVGRNLPTQDTEERRETVLKMLIDTILLSQVAKDRKIIDEADIQRRINFARNQGLMNQVLTFVGQQAETEESIRKAYEEVVVKPAQNDRELHLRHIFFLVKDPKDDAAWKDAEDRAEAALVRVKKGENFAAVVSDVSDDPVAKANGGDFGWRLARELGKEYTDAGFKMKDGEVSPVIRTLAGFHIIKREGERTRKPEELDKLRDRVAAMVSASAQFELVNNVRAAAKIERVDQPNAKVKVAPSAN